MSTKSYKFGNLSYRIETMRNAWRVEWETPPAIGSKVLDPFSGIERTVDGVDRAGLILSTDATGFQSASAPWDLTPCDSDRTDTGSEQARGKA